MTSVVGTDGDIRFAFGLGALVKVIAQCMNVVLDRFFLKVDKQLPQGGAIRRLVWLRQRAREQPLAVAPAAVMHAVFGTLRRVKRCKQRVCEFGHAVITVAARRCQIAIRPAHHFAVHCWVVVLDRVAPRRQQ